VEQLLETDTAGSCEHSFQLGARYTSLCWLMRGM
jgi:hypothetical protein